MSENTVTSISMLQEYARGQLVELPPFAEGQEFFAMLKRPSLMALSKTGRIPNELLSSAMGLFTASNKSSTKEKDATEVLNDMNDMLEVICEASFVSPTYSEIKNAGIELTDEQKTFVFQYAQEGVRALNSFRNE